MRNALVIIALAALGCAGEEPEIELEAELEIGGANDDGLGFVALADGDSPVLVTGGQGGFHVWTGLRVLGASGELYLDREARRVSDNTLVLRADDQYLDVPTGAMDDWWTRDAATPSFMCPAPIGITIYESELEFSARLYTKDGKLLAEDSIVLSPVCPDGEQAANCRRLCDG